MHRLCKALPAIAICALAFACATASAQDALNRAASLQAFALYTHVAPHYGPSTNNGVSLGLDLNARPLYRLQPSLEARFTFAPGSDVTENTYNFGPRLEYKIGRLHPSIFALIGTGGITFHHPITFPSGPYTHDNSIIWSGGIGTDYMVTPRIGLRADVLLQRWNLGSGSSSVIFHPRLYSIGVSYRF
jgi:hypothetical protein